MESVKKGLLIVLSGPSGVGKGTVRKVVFRNSNLNLAYSISMTTRKPRKREQDGVDYFFVSEEEFKRRLENDEFLEHAYFVGNYYGTPKDYVEKLRNEGKNVFLEIEVEGAKQVLSKCKGDDVISIFLLPPSLEELERRIRGRKSEPDEIIKERLDKAAREIGLKDNYDYAVLNENIGQAASYITRIIKRKLKQRGQ